MPKKIINIAFYIIAVFYAFLMLDLVFRIFSVASGSEAVRSYNFVPFKTILEYLRRENNVSASLSIYNVLGNIAVFIPYGLYLQVLLKNKAIGKSLLIVLATTVLVEIIQYVFARGTCDIDDVMLNLMGGALGILWYRGLLKWQRDEGKAKTAVTVISVAIGLPIMIVYFMMALRRFI